MGWLETQIEEAKKRHRPLSDMTGGHFHGPTPGAPTGPPAGSPASPERSAANAAAMNPFAGAKATATVRTVPPPPAGIRPMADHEAAQAALMGLRNGQPDDKFLKLITRGTGSINDFLLSKFDGTLSTPLQLIFGSARLTIPQVDRLVTDHPELLTPQQKADVIRAGLPKLEMPAPLKEGHVSGAQSAGAALFETTPGSAAADQRTTDASSVIGEPAPAPIVQVAPGHVRYPDHDVTLNKQNAEKATKLETEINTLKDQISSLPQNADGTFDLNANPAARQWNIDLVAKKMQLEDARNRGPIPDLPESPLDKSRRNEAWLTSPVQTDKTAGEDQMVNGPMGAQIVHKDPTPAHLADPIPDLTYQKQLAHTDAIMHGLKPDTPEYNDYITAKMQAFHDAFDTMAERKTYRESNAKTIGEINTVRDAELAGENDSNALEEASLNDLTQLVNDNEANARAQGIDVDTIRADILRKRTVLNAKKSLALIHKHLNVVDRQFDIDRVAQYNADPELQRKYENYTYDYYLGRRAEEILPNDFSEQRGKIISAPTDPNQTYLGITEDGHTIKFKSRDVKEEKVIVDTGGESGMPTSESRWVHKEGAIKTILLPEVQSLDNYVKAIFGKNNPNNDIIQSNPAKSALAETSVGINIPQDKLKKVFVDMSKSLSPEDIIALQSYVGRVSNKDGTGSRYPVRVTGEFDLQTRIGLAQMWADSAILQLGLSPSAWDFTKPSGKKFAGGSQAENTAYQYLQDMGGWITDLNAKHPEIFAPSIASGIKRHDNYDEVSQLSTPAVVEDARLKFNALVSRFGSGKANEWFNALAADFMNPGQIIQGIEDIQSGNNLEKNRRRDEYYKMAIDLRGPLETPDAVTQTLYKHYGIEAIPLSERQSPVIQLSTQNVLRDAMGKLTELKDGINDVGVDILGPGAWDTIGQAAGAITHYGGWSTGITPLIKASVYTSDLLHQASAAAFYMLKREDILRLRPDLNGDYSDQSFFENFHRYWDASKGTSLISELSADAGWDPDQYPNWNLTANITADIATYWLTKKIGMGAYRAPIAGSPISMEQAIRDITRTTHLGKIKKMLPDEFKNSTGLISRLSNGGQRSDTARLLDEAGITGQHTFYSGKSLQERLGKYAYTLPANKEILDWLGSNTDMAKLFRFNKILMADEDLAPALIATKNGEEAFQTIEAYVAKTGINPWGMLDTFHLGPWRSAIHHAATELGDNRVGRMARFLTNPIRSEELMRGVSADRLMYQTIMEIGSQGKYTDDVINGMLHSYHDTLSSFRKEGRTLADANLQFSKEVLDEYILHDIAVTRDRWDPKLPLTPEKRNELTSALAQMKKQRGGMDGIDTGLMPSHSFDPRSKDELDKMLTTASGGLAEGSYAMATGINPNALWKKIPDPKAATNNLQILKRQANNILNNRDLNYNDMNSFLKTFEITDRNMPAVAKATSNIISQMMTAVYKDKIMTGLSRLDTAGLNGVITGLSGVADKLIAHAARTDLHPGIDTDELRKIGKQMKAVAGYGNDPELIATNLSKGILRLSEYTDKHSQLGVESDKVIEKALNSLLPASVEADPALQPLLELVYNPVKTQGLIKDYDRQTKMLYAIHRMMAEEPADVTTLPAPKQFAGTYDASDADSAAYGGPDMAEGSPEWYAKKQTHDIAVGKATRSENYQDRAHGIWRHGQNDPNGKQIKTLGIALGLQVEDTIPETIDNIYHFVAADPTAANKVLLIDQDLPSQIKLQEATLKAGGTPVIYYPAAKLENYPKNVSKDLRFSDPDGGVFKIEKGKRIDTPTDTANAELAPVKTFVPKNKDDIEARLKAIYGAVGREVGMDSDHMLLVSGIQDTSGYQMAQAEKYRAKVIEFIDAKGKHNRTIQPVEPQDFRNQNIYTLQENIAKRYDIPHTLQITEKYYPGLDNSPALKSIQGTRVGLGMDEFNFTTGGAGEFEHGKYLLSSGSDGGRFKYLYHRLHNLNPEEVKQYPNLYFLLKEMRGGNVPYPTNPETPVPTAATGNRVKKTLTPANLPKGSGYKPLDEALDRHLFWLTLNSTDTQNDPGFVRELAQLDQNLHNKQPNRKKAKNFSSPDALRAEAELHTQKGALIRERSRAKAIRDEQTAIDTETRRQDTASISYDDSQAGADEKAAAKTEDIGGASPESPLIEPEGESNYYPNALERLANSILGGLHQGKPRTWRDVLEMEFVPLPPKKDPRMVRLFSDWLESPDNDPDFNPNEIDLHDDLAIGQAIRDKKLVINAKPGLKDQRLKDPRLKDQYLKLKDRHWYFPNDEENPNKTALFFIDVYPEELAGTSNSLQITLKEKTGSKRLARLNPTDQQVHWRDKTMHQDLDVYDSLQMFDWNIEPDAPLQETSGMSVGMSKGYGPNNEYSSHDDLSQDVSYEDETTPIERVSSTNRTVGESIDTYHGRSGGSNPEATSRDTGLGMDLKEYQRPLKTFDVVMNHEDGTYSIDPRGIAKIIARYPEQGAGKKFVSTMVKKLILPMHRKGRLTLAQREGLFEEADRIIKKMYDGGLKYVNADGVKIVTQPLGKVIKANPNLRSHLLANQLIREYYGAAADPNVDVGKALMNDEYVHTGYKPENRAAGEPGYVHGGGFRSEEDAKHFEKQQELKTYRLHEELLKSINGFQPGKERKPAATNAFFGPRLHPSEPAGPQHNRLLAEAKIDFNRANRLDQLVKSFGDAPTSQQLENLFYNADFQELMYGAHRYESGRVLPKFTPGPDKHLNSENHKDLIKAINIDEVKTKIDDTLHSSVGRVHQLQNSKPIATRPTWRLRNETKYEGTPGHELPQQQGETFLMKTGPRRGEQFKFIGIANSATGKRNKIWVQFEGDKDIASLDTYDLPESFRSSLSDEKRWGTLTKSQAQIEVKTTEHGKTIIKEFNGGIEDSIWNEVLDLISQPGANDKSVIDDLSKTRMLLAGQMRRQNSNPLPPISSIGERNGYELQLIERMLRIYNSRLHERDFNPKIDPEINQLMNELILSPSDARAKGIMDDLKRQQLEQSVTELSASLSPDMEHYLGQREKQLEAYLGTNRYQALSSSGETLPDIPGVKTKDKRSIDGKVTQDLLDELNAALVKVDPKQLTEHLQITHILDKSSRPRVEQIAGILGKERNQREIKYMVPQDGASAAYAMDEATNAERILSHLIAEKLNTADYGGIYEPRLDADILNLATKVMMLRKRNLNIEPTHAANILNGVYEVIPQEGRRAIMENMKSIKDKVQPAIDMQDMMNPALGIKTRFKEQIQLQRQMIELQHQADNAVGDAKKLLIEKKNEIAQRYRDNKDYIKNGMTFKNGINIVEYHDGKRIVAPYTYQDMMSYKHFGAQKTPGAVSEKMDWLTRQWKRVVLSWPSVFAKMFGDEGVARMLAEGIWPWVGRDVPIPAELSGRVNAAHRRFMTDSIGSYGRVTLAPSKYKAEHLQQLLQDIHNNDVARTYLEALHTPGATPETALDVLKTELKKQNGSQFEVISPAKTSLGKVEAFKELDGNKLDQEAAAIQKILLEQYHLDDPRMAALYHKTNQMHETQTPLDLTKHDLSSLYADPTKGLPDIRPNISIEARYAPKNIGQSLMNAPNAAFDKAWMPLDYLNTKSNAKRYQKYVVDYRHRTNYDTADDATREMIDKRGHEFAINEVHNNTYNMNRTAIEGKLRNFYPFMPATRDFYTYWGKKLMENPLMVMPYVEMQEYPDYVDMAGSNWLKWELSPSSGIYFIQKPSQVAPAIGPIYSYLANEFATQIPGIGPGIKQAINAFPGGSYISPNAGLASKFDNAFYYGTAAFKKTVGINDTWDGDRLPFIGKEGAQDDEMITMKAAANLTNAAWRHDVLHEAGIAPGDERSQALLEQRAYEQARYDYTNDVGTQALIQSINPAGGRKIDQSYNILKAMRAYNSANTPEEAEQFRKFITGEGGSIPDSLKEYNGFMEPLGDAENKQQLANELTPVTVFNNWVKYQQMDNNGRRQYLADNKWMSPYITVGENMGMYWKKGDSTKMVMGKMFDKAGAASNAQNSIDAGKLRAQFDAANAATIASGEYVNRATLEAQQAQLASMHTQAMEPGYYNYNDRLSLSSDVFSGNAGRNQSMIPGYQQYQDTANQKDVGELLRLPAEALTQNDRRSLGMNDGPQASQGWNEYSAAVAYWEKQMHDNLGNSVTFSDYKAIDYANGLDNSINTLKDKYGKEWANDYDISQLPAWAKLKTLGIGDKSQAWQQTYNRLDAATKEIADMKAGPDRDAAWRRAVADIATLKNENAQLKKEMDMYGNKLLDMPNSKSSKAYAGKDSSYAGMINAYGYTKKSYTRRGSSGGKKARNYKGALKTSSKYISGSPAARGKTKQTKKRKPNIYPRNYYPK